MWRHIRRSPGTFLRLAILFVTTQVIRHVDPGIADDILERRSTNIHYLTEQPARVLIRSALWIDGSSWFFYFLLCNIFHATAERWRGTWRWLAVLVTAHVGATCISQGTLAWMIRHGHAEESMRFTLDYGVSHALAGIIAVLVYWLVKPWCYVYCAGVLLFYFWPLIHNRTFTDLGHFSAVLIGLACYPVVRPRGTGLFDPVAAARQAFHRVFSRAAPPTPPAGSPEPVDGRQRRPQVPLGARSPTSRVRTGGMRPTRAS